MAVNLGVYPHKPLGWSAVGEAWPCADFFPIIIYIILASHDHGRPQTITTVVSEHEHLYRTSGIRPYRNKGRVSAGNRYPEIDDL